MNKLFTLTIFVLFLFFGASLQKTFAQSSGGTFAVTQSVQAGGGGKASGGNYRVEGTAAQPAVDEPMNTPPYALRSGFWNPLFAATAASATIGGRVLNPDGLPLKNAVVNLSGGNMFNSRIARTNGFGYFTFDEVEVNHFYVLTVSSKRYGFANMTYSLTLTDNFTDIVFQASWQN